MSALTIAHFRPCDHCGAGELQPCADGSHLLPWTHAERSRP